MRKSALFGMVALAVSLPASLTLAERTDCDLDATGLRQCTPRAPCATRAGCIAGPGTDDWVCEPIVSPTASGRECMPNCSTLFSCGIATDCPTINGIAGSCSPTVTAPMICTWFASGGTSAPPAAQVTYCVSSPTSHVSDMQIAACHTLPGTSPAEYTADYFAGDCDGDGCANGQDTNPCARPTAGGSCMATNTFESPFCAPLPAYACDVTGTTLSCGDARPCNPDATVLPCAVGACEAGWSDVPRCRPPCSTLFLCSTGTLVGGGAPPEQCPMLDGVTGVCAPLPPSIAPVDGRDGLCVYSDFFDTSCVGVDPTIACFRDPAGALTTNYYEGDCDDDGAPNGCDTERCVGGGGTSACVMPPGIGCTPSFTPDAGVDAAASPDSGVDAGNTTQSDAGLDAATDTDAGTSASDAASGMDGGLAVGFGGGGGCRCAAAGTSARPWVGTALALLALGLTMRRRARR